MRADNIQAAASGGLRINAKTGSFTDSLRKGDSIRAQVTSSDNGVLTLKTDKGQIFTASQDFAKNVSVGDKLLLDVTSKDNGMLTLSVREPEEALEDKPATKAGGDAQNAQNTNLVRDFSDRSLLQFAAKLSELNLPVNEKTAAMMKKLMASNPNMTLEQAAFLAANKLADDGPMQKAAMDTLTENVKTDALLGKIIQMLEDAGFEKVPQAGKNINQAAEQAPESAQKQAAAGTTGEAAIKDSAQKAPLTKFFEQLGLKIGADTAQGASGASHPNSIIPQSDTILQSTNSTKNAEILQKDNITQNISPNQTAETPEAAKNNAALGAADTQKSETDASLQKAAAGAETIKSGAQAPSPAAAGSAPTAGTIAQVLSQIPEFKGTPPEALQKFSNMLLGVAAESAEAMAKGGPENLAATFEKLFTKIQTDDPALGAKLAQAKDELFARLSIMQEVVSAGGTSAGAELVDTTGRLLNHVRLLNNIDQFMYMQLPIIMQEEKKTVEMFLFKRKGGRKPDPENVNILLALDLENMGRCEAFLNIRNKDISVKMKVDGQRQKDFFSENTVLLHNMLDQSGFKLTGTDISVKEENTTLLTAMLALENFTTSGTRGIDFYH